MPEPIKVYETEAQADERKARLIATNKEKPDHWATNKGDYFVNPWPSYVPFSWRDGRAWFDMLTKQPQPSKDTKISQKIPVVKPTWGISTSATDDGGEDKNLGKLKATWLGHACFLVELPAVSPFPRGPRILFDPVFSDRCSPFQHLGPKRFTPPPCPVEEIPEVDAIVISHNHYDHLDTPTITILFSRARKPHIFAPLGNESYFQSLPCIPAGHSHTLDWWDSRRVEVGFDLPDTMSTRNTNIEAHKLTAKFDVTCTPGQHRTGRGLLDHFKSLWAGWVVETVPPVTGGEQQSPEPKLERSKEGRKVYFAGDTAYRSVLEGQDEDKVPVCPAFKEIGERWGGFDLALLPIGAYEPRSIMSRVHCAPQDSVRIFQDIRAKRAIGMHWGTWVLTTEGIHEPPERLLAECRKADIEEGVFRLCEIGETLFY
ncbi:Metallo-hydrolase/oxidoreductase [Marasmius fiardii PR-910]|nr:Metallo-hydrolase/oxidoreductase [Marasmius fiardii PR-910]